MNRHHFHLSLSFAEGEVVTILRDPFLHFRRLPSPARRALSFCFDDQRIYTLARTITYKYVDVNGNFSAREAAPSFRVIPLDVIEPRSLRRHCISPWAAYNARVRIINNVIESKMKNTRRIFPIFFVQLLLVVAAYAQSKRPMTPEDVVSLNRASDAQMSPDGRRVAFVVNSWDRENDRFNSDIWLVDELRQAIRMTSHPRRDDSPRWSPDARRIAFLSERGADAEAGAQILPAQPLGRRACSTDLAQGADSKFRVVARRPAHSVHRRGAAREVQDQTTDRSRRRSPFRPVVGRQCVFGRDQGR